MKQILRQIFVAIIFTACGASSLQAQNVGPQNIADLVEGLTPAVVNISSTQKAQQMPAIPNFPDFPQFPEGSPFEHFFEDFMGRHQRMIPAPRPTSSLGSGFIVDAKEKLIVTNNHVIRDADEVRVTFYDDETITAEVVGRDEKTDIAVLRVDTDKELTAATFGDSDSVRVGDWIVAIGNPFGLGGTVTAGIVSARQRDIDSGPYDDFLQTDASINRGNSGGPMFNMKGEVIGINTAIFSPSGGSVGIGFAIPSSLAEPVIRQIVKYGHTRRGWLGVRIQSITEEIADSLGLESEDGALIASVTQDGPAQKAGLQAGDIILSFNGENIKEMRRLPRLVAETDIASNVQVEYWRDGETKKTTVTIGELEKAEENGLVETDMPFGKMEQPKDTNELQTLGMTLSPVTETLRDEYALPEDVNGLVVTAIDLASEAERKGIMIGDIITEVNQHKIETLDALTEIVERARSVGRKSVLLLISRDQDVRFIALKLDDEK